MTERGQARDRERVAAVRQGAELRAGVRAEGAPPAAGPSPLVGRQAELALLESELARAAAGEFRCILVLGDAGMGKTRLATEFAARASRRVRVLAARAYPFGQSASFGVWAEAIERHLRLLPHHEVVDLCGGYLDDLAGLLRSVAAARGAAPEGAQPVFRVADGLATVLANVAVTSPVLVTFDDVHLADASSWEALHYLAHSLSDCPVLVVVSARPSELAEHPCAGSVVAALEQADLLRRFTLPPVNDEALRELAQHLVGAPAPAALVRWLAQRSAGNPLFAQGLLRALVEEGADLANPRLRRLPEVLTERVAGRLADLDPLALQTLELLAVMARPLTLDELAELSTRSLDETAAVVNRLVRHRFVSDHPAEPGAEYDLIHPLLQEVIYTGTLPGRRQELHRIAARALLAGGRYGDAANHYSRCAEVGEAEAVDALRVALAEAEQRQAYLEGLDILTTLVAVLPGSDPRWADIAEALPTQAHWTMDDRVEIGAVRGMNPLRAVESVLGQTEDRARQAVIKIRLARFIGWGVGDLTEAARLAADARDLFADVGDTRSMVVASGALAHLCAIAGDWPAMQAEATRITQSVTTLGEPTLAAAALLPLVRCWALNGQFDEARESSDRLIELGRAAAGSDHLSWILAMTAAHYTFEGRAREVGPLLVEAKAGSEAWRRGIVVIWETGIHWIIGDVHAAQDCARRFFESQPDAISPRRGIGAALAALAALEADRPTEAKACIDRSAHAFGGRGWGSYELVLDHAAAALAYRSGERDAALAMLSATVSAQLERHLGSFAALALLDQAEWAADKPVDPAAGLLAAHRLARLAAIANRDLHRGYAAFARGWHELATGNLDDAAAGAREAESVFAGLGYPLFSGRALVLLGRARAGSDRQGAMKAFDQAAAIFDSCGAVWRREQVRALLRELGTQGRRRADARSGPESMTRREREVAQLACQGQTARQIARTLFVGERTIEGHLASVYSKLGISSKVELARLAERLGL